MRSFALFAVKLFADHLLHNKQADDADAVDGEDEHEDGEEEEVSEHGSNPNVHLSEGSSPENGHTLNKSWYILDARRRVLPPPFHHLAGVDAIQTEDAEQAELVDDVLVDGGDGLLVLVEDAGHHVAGEHAHQEDGEGDGVPHPPEVPSQLGFRCSLCHRNSLFRE